MKNPFEATFYRRIVKIAIVVSRENSTKTTSSIKYQPLYLALPMAFIKKLFKQKLYIKELRIFLVIIRNSFGAPPHRQIAKIALVLGLVNLRLSISLSPHLYVAPIKKIFQTKIVCQRNAHIFSYYKKLIRSNPLPSNCKNNPRRIILIREY